MSDDKRFFECDCSDLGCSNESEMRARLYNVLEVMRPKPSPFEFLRLGGTEDGAYLLPAALDGIEACFSPGVFNRKTFEDQLTNEHNIACHMCDYSSDESQFATPLILGKQTFDKLWLEPTAGDLNIDLESWIDKYYPNGCGDLILQMDIEGAEYRNIMSIKAETLSLFRIFILEVHGLLQLNSPEVLNNVIYPVFNKIGAIFTCIHIHPNNYAQKTFVSDANIDIFDVVELTFIRTDVYSNCVSGALRPVFVPHPLDVSNAKYLAPAVLSEFWCSGTRPVESRIKILEDNYAFDSQTNRNFQAGVAKAVEDCVEIAKAGAFLSGISLPTGYSEEKEMLTSLEEVAAGRPFNLSDSYLGWRKEGKVSSSQDYFFHTQMGWDQFILIDLGDVRTLRAIKIVNRKDACFDRARCLYLSFSQGNGIKSTERKIYVNVPDAFKVGENVEMLLPIPSVITRYVKIGSPIFTALHFADVQAYAIPRGQ